LADSAVAWLEAVAANTPEDDISWSRFKEIFEEKFMPATGKSRLYCSFMDLKQGGDVGGRI